MLFTSQTFLGFLAIVFVLHWFVCGRAKRLQNSLLIIASYIFYGWFDWRFCGLLALSTISAYVCGGRIGEGGEPKKSGKRKAWLWVGVAINIGVLGFFKYFNFFAESIADLLSSIGLSTDIPTLNLMLPIGISFYSFMAISYVVDVYRETIKSAREPIAFVSAMSFFPQLLAGPIGRMSEMLPQFELRRDFDYAMAVDGCRQMLWGFFKKIVIADGCATLTDRLFLEPSAFSGSVLAVGVFMYAVQIYADFSGNAEITQTKEFDLAAYTEGDGSDISTEKLAGGWEVAEDRSSAVIPQEAKDAFDKAAENLDGNELEPMALLGTQVVAGKNYAFLCFSTLQTEETIKGIQVVTVYEDLSGNAEITNISAVNPADYNK